ncbi:MAG: phosphatidate cytidylyltransferase [Muribaculaceae bacterium]|nr:phosphatidate cytidylyltransferase [Muribaculaceae bacterium]
MHKFLIRAVSGIIYAAVIIFCIIYGGWALTLMAIAFAIICMCELDNMAYGFSRNTFPIFLLDLLGVGCLFWVLTWKYAIFYWVFLNIIRPIIARRLPIHSESGKNPANFGEVYTSAAFVLMLAAPNSRLALLVFIMLWLNDSGAYIVGSLIGKHKLCPSISPNKTWEGFFGGVLITFLGAFLLDKFCPGLFAMDNYGIGIWMILSASTCIFGTIGDLIESKCKRIYGIKDSGNWIPGHGGLLDRVDSFLIAYPVAFILILYIF